MLAGKTERGFIDDSLLVGLGGATGSWASQVMVRALNGMGKRISALVTEPFGFERKRMRIADDAQAAFQSVDYLVVGSNQHLIAGSKPGDSLDDAFTRMNKLMYEAWTLIEQGELEAGQYCVTASGIDYEDKE